MWDAFETCDKIPYQQLKQLNWQRPVPDEGTLPVPGDSSRNPLRYSARTAPETRPNKEHQTSGK
jgi:hypothetical protein